MSKKVLLHVGTPKTGTSYLQDVLWRNQGPLGRAGIKYPGERFDAHFLAALDLMKLRWGGLEQDAIGAWDRLAKSVREYDGTSILSHEILANASRSQAERALASLGDAEVHLVLSARDLVRQIPAEWQENIKHRSRFTYARFLELIQDPERAHRVSSWFWAVQELPDILERWGAGIPPEHIHVVTLPLTGPKDELWHRFETAFGLGGIDLDLGTRRSNPSLGVPEVALIRRINRQAVRDLPPEHYRPLVRELLAHQTLSERTDTARLSLPPTLRPWVDGITESWITELSARGYDVIGDLADLRGLPEPEGPWADPDRARPREVANAAVVAVRALLLEAAGLREENERLREEILAQKREVLRGRHPHVMKTMEWTVRRLEGSERGRKALTAYRFARGRNSRSA